MSQKVGEDRYYELGEDTVETLTELLVKCISTPIKISYTFQGDKKLKSLISVSKIADRFAFKLESPIMVEVNEILWDEINHEQETVDILVREACSNIVINGESGKITTSNKDDFKSSKGVLDKYEYEAVSRAKELQELTLAQIADKEKDTDIDISQ